MRGFWTIDRPGLGGVILVAIILLGTVSTSYPQPAPPAPAAKGPSLDPRGELFQFGTLEPQRREYTIEKIKVYHDGARVIPVTVSLAGLRHEESNFGLIVEQWCHLTPAQGSASREHPFEFNFRIKFPLQMPAGIPDGLYIGKLRVESPNAAAPIEIPFHFTLDLPDFTPHPAELAETGLRVEMYCCLPGSRRTSFGLTTDAERDQTVRVIAPLILINEETGESLKAAQARVNLGNQGEGEEEIIIAPGNSPTDIDLAVEVNDPRLPSGHYGGELAVRAELGRTLFIPIHLVIPTSFWVSWIGNVSLVLTLIIGLLIPARPLRRLWQGRNRFQGSTFTVNRLGTNYRIPRPWDQFLNLKFFDNPARWQLTSSSCQVTGTPWDPPTPPNTLYLTEPTNFRLTCRGEHYQMRLQRWNPNTLSFRVVGSPYRWGRQIAELVFLTVLLGFALGSFLYPALWCRMLP